MDLLNEEYVNIPSGEMGVGEVDIKGEMSEAAACALSLGSFGAGWTVIVSFLTTLLTPISWGKAVAISTSFGLTALVFSGLAGACLYLYVSDNEKGRASALEYFIALFVINPVYWVFAAVMIGLERLAELYMATVARKRA